MKVLVLPADTGGCGHYRLVMAAEHLRAQGHDIVIHEAGPSSGFHILLDDNDRVLDFKLPVDDVDVVVMQRVSHDLHAQVIPVMRSKGVAVVIDMDDDLSTIHPKNSAFWTYRNRSTTPFSFKNAAEVCRVTTLVTVSTHSLLKVYAKHGRGHVLDNYVPERYTYINGLTEDEPVFGWGGTIKSHPVDLLACGKAVKELVDQGYRFKVVGPGEPEIQRQLYLSKPPETTGRTDMFGWPTALATIDVGMAPLEASAFNTSKSRLKVLEYASLGIPYVASPREEYRRFHKESGGAGILADTPKQWVAGIKQLLTDDSLRKEMSDKGRSYAMTQTIEKNSWRWLEAWTRAYDIERGGK